MHGTYPSSISLHLLVDTPKERDYAPQVPAPQLPV